VALHHGDEGCPRESELSGSTMSSADHPIAFTKHRYDVRRSASASVRIGADSAFFVLMSVICRSSTEPVVIITARSMTFCSSGYCLANHDP